ncbi:MAG: HPF/RaiA family ribosome-associated protein [Spirochaetales bacterium]|jgi:putative sigma-54 modulation protein|nr:HPF/RaiA family ribosome-associated protein [Spirochaetales bacterium]
MNLEIRGVHYNISDTTQEFIEKKLERIDFAKDYIVDLSVLIIKEPEGLK